jgi:quinol monooxygenase YgiN
MNRSGNALAVVLAACVALSYVVPATAAEPQVAHMVYFKLKDSSDAAKAKLVAACNKYLSEHEGTVYYSAGVIAQDMSRDVNDKDFDVALNLVFRNKAAHDKYATHPRHQEFIDQHKDSWAKVRVFDSYISTE